MTKRETLNVRLERFYAEARKAGLRITPQRLAIFKLVAGSVSHPGAEEIHRQLRRSFPMISLDTVYRTLWKLADLGLVSALGQERIQLRFDANQNRHQHFTCKRCGLIRDFTNARLSALGIPSEAAQFGQAEDLRVEVRGVCSACLRKKAPGEGKNNRSKPKT